MLGRFWSVPDPPLGFPSCPSCSYLSTGPSRLCLSCARQSFQTIAKNACPVCSQVLEGGSCPNWLCADPNRRIKRIRAIAYHTDQLRQTIIRSKYKGKSGWSLLFGRLRVAWLDQHARDDTFDLVVANPTYTGEGGNAFAHTEQVLDAAATEDLLGTWPFDVATTRVIVKTRQTSKSAGGDVGAKRRAAAELLDALCVPDPARTRGRRILVYDNVCTTGSQLDAVARCLSDAGRFRPSRPGGRRSPSRAGASWPGTWRGRRQRGARRRSARGLPRAATLRRRSGAR